MKNNGTGFQEVEGGVASTLQHNIPTLDEIAEENARINATMHSTFCLRAQEELEKARQDPTVMGAVIVLLHRAPQNPGVLSPMNLIAIGVEAMGCSNSLIAARDMLVVSEYQNQVNRARQNEMAASNQPVIADGENHG